MANVMREHTLTWKENYQREYADVMAECNRVVGLGGSFEIKDRYDHELGWVTIIRVYYFVGVDSNG